MQGFTWLEKTKVAAGTYSAVHAVFPQATQGSTTWTAADSRTTPLPDLQFTVAPVSFLTQSCLFQTLTFCATVTAHCGAGPQSARSLCSLVVT